MPVLSKMMYEEAAPAPHPPVFHVHDILGYGWEDKVDLQKARAHGEPRMWAQVPDHHYPVWLFWLVERKLRGFEAVLTGRYASLPDFLARPHPEDMEGAKVLKEGIDILKSWMTCRAKVDTGSAALLPKMKDEGNGDKVVVVQKKETVIAGPSGDELPSNPGNKLERKAITRPAGRKGRVATLIAKFEQLAPSLPSKRQMTANLGNSGHVARIIKEIKNKPFAPSPPFTVNLRNSGQVAKCVSKFEHKLLSVTPVT